LTKSQFFKTFLNFDRNTELQKSHPRVENNAQRFFSKQTFFVSAAESLYARITRSNFSPPTEARTNEMKLNLWTEESALDPQTSQPSSERALPLLQSSWQLLLRPIEILVAIVEGACLKKMENFFS
jgi:hypothetical protein